MMGESLMEKMRTLVSPVFDAFEPATQEELEAAERAMGVSLPPFFREFQLVFGRCMFEGEASISCAGEVFDVLTIFGCKGDAGNFVHDFESHEDYRAAGLVPLGDDTFNNRFVWHMHNGAVSFVDYAGGSARLLPVADTVEAFFDSIVVKPWE